MHRGDDPRHRQDEADEAGQPTQTKRPNRRNAVDREVQRNEDHPGEKAEIETGKAQRVEEASEAREAGLQQRAGAHRPYHSERLYVLAMAPAFLLSVHTPVDSGGDHGFRGSLHSSMSATKGKRRLLLTAVLLSTLPGPVYGWGTEGHVVVAELAERRLTEPARAEVHRLLGDASLASVATWADEIRTAEPETAHWHFVDMELADGRYRPDRDCRPTPTGDCLIAALDRFIATLRDRHSPAEARATALKFVVHLIADLHQPLHCADNHDHGGNDVAVQFFMEPTNLHRVWDSGLLQKTGLREHDYAKHLDEWLTHHDSHALTKGTVVDWALESHAVAVRHIYSDLP